MLILTRKKEESIIIGEEIKLTVVGVKGNQVQLGIEAPKEIEIHRQEVYERIKAENRQASEIKITQLKEVMEQIKNND